VYQFEFGDKGSDPSRDNNGFAGNDHVATVGLTPCPQIQTDTLPEPERLMPGPRFPGLQQYSQNETCSM
jgi:hypothetical protein